MTKLIRITSPYFVAGIVREDGKTIQIAPIIAYMKLWRGQAIVNHCKKKDWKIEVINCKTN